MKGNILKILSKLSFFICLIVIEYLATAKISFKAPALSWDKANHFIAFFVLYILLSLSYKLDTKIKCLILLLFGIQIECVQHFLPFRDFSLLDILADSVGITLGVVFFNLVSKIKWVKENFLIHFK